MGNPKVYVGTYAKYNNGSLSGQWVDLTQFANYSEFVKKCRTIHKDESDPELMIQDYENFPDGLSCGEWISEQDYNDVISEFKTENTSLNCQIIEYSDKAFAVVGDTKPIKDELKKLGGRFNGKLSCGAGWIFSKKAEESVKSLLQCGTIERTASVVKNKVDAELLEEYINEKRKAWSSKDMIDHFRKKVGGLYRLSNGGLLRLEKPSIETSFCFGYSDSRYDTEDYDRANNMVHHASTNEDYFLKENLHWYDLMIKKINKGEDHLCIHRVSYSSQKEPLNVWEFSVLPWHTFYEYTEGSHRTWLTDLSEVNDEDRTIILNALKEERAKFEKRLKTYLKKYGLSKLKVWSYWQDA